MSESDTEQVPVLDDVLDMDPDPDEDHRYIVLYDEDYDDLILDTEDSVALRVDCNQAVEILRLTSKVVSALAPDHAPDKEPIEAMIDALQEVSDGDE
jgi:hypothetical protein